MRLQIPSEYSMPVLQSILDIEVSAGGLISRFEFENRRRKEHKINHF